MRARSVLYLCDGKACGDECPNELCHHTAKPEHALHPDRDIAEFETWPDPVEAYRDQGTAILVEPSDG